MAKKTLTVRLLCSLDNGKRQWKPDDCAELAEDQAQDLLKLGLAELLVSAAEEAAVPQAEESTPDAPARDDTPAPEGGPSNG